MAIQLYEQSNNAGSHVGRDVEIEYPGVSSCITVTFYFPKWMAGGPILVGAHFGMFDGGVNIKTATIDNMITQMRALFLGTSAQTYTPANYLVIGQIGNWHGMLTERNYLYKKIAQTAGVAQISDEHCWDIGSDGFESATIKVTTSGQIKVSGNRPVKVLGTVKDEFGYTYPYPVSQPQAATRQRVFEL
jgi:hypothetical protein